MRFGRRPLSEEELGRARAELDRLDGALTRQTTAPAASNGEQRHRAAFADGSHAYFVGYEEGNPTGFALLRFWNAPERSTLVRRIAVVAPGRGHGRRLLSAVVDRMFEETDAHRVQIGLYPDNLRARRAYEAVGFRAEGISRGSAYFGGIFRDELVMSLLRPEWEGRSG